MRKISLMIFLLLFFTLWMTYPAGSTGTVGFEFLRTLVGARPSAMAGAFVSLPGDLNSIYYNPAGLAEIKTRTGTFTYLNHLLDFQSGFVGYVHPFEKRGSLGLGIYYIDYGEFQRTDISGKENGTFGAGSLCMSVTYGSKFSDALLYGMSLKYIRSSIDSYTADAFAVDLGGIYHVPLMENLDVGFGIFNLGKARTAFIATKEDLPLNFKLGFSKRLAHLPLLLSFNLNKYIDDDFQWALGGEFTLREGLFLRCGYNSLGTKQKVGTDKDAFAGVSLGLGLLWKIYQLDYSFSSFGEVGSLNRISFSGSF